MKISFINDEYSEDIHRCIDFCRAKDIRYIELRKIDGKNIANLEKQQIEEIAEVLRKNDIQVSSIASPFLKWDNDRIPADDFKFKIFGTNKECLDSLIEYANILGTSNIRIFSFLKNVFFNVKFFAGYLHKLDDYIEKKHINLLLENEPVCNIATIYDLYTFFRIYKFNNIFPLIDIGNCRQNVVSKQELDVVAQSCFYYHIKDYSKKSNMYVALGDGDMDFDYLLNIAKNDSFLSLETHTGNQKDFITSVQILKDMLNV